MRVLYGVCGEGMGHATRSQVVVAHLLARGNDVRVASSGAALRHLERAFPGRTVSVTGLEICKDKSAVDVVRTSLSNLVRFGVGVATDIPAFLSVAAWKPEVVFSDFECWSARTAHALGLPLFAVDNIHAYSRCSHPPEVTAAVPAHALGAGLLLADAMVPFARRYLVTSAFPGIPKDASTEVFPPILRRKVLGARRHRDLGAPRGHLTVYLAQVGIPHDALAALPTESHVWVSSNFSPAFDTDRVSYRPFNEDDFIQDLATARGVLTSAGHSLLSEAAYLGVPALVVPLRGQYEQELNASYVDYLGWGERADPGDLNWERISFFLERAPQYAETLSHLPPHDQNVSLLHATDLCLASCL